MPFLPSISLCYFLRNTGFQYISISTQGSNLNDRVVDILKIVTHWGKETNLGHKLGYYPIVLVWTYQF